jgi:hypothetical protein
MTLTINRLHELLSYDPATGNFMWKVGRQGTNKGQPAGGLDNRGYRFIRIDGRRYYAHRLVLFYESGEWPPEQVDHINGAKGDNRRSNLRLATPSQQSANSKLAVNNTSGAKGVVWSKRRRKWQVQVINFGTKHLGYYTNFDDARAAYRAGAIKFFGEYARCT